LITIINYRDPQPTDGVVIETTSRSRNWSKDLSPFFLGPCNLYQSYWSYNVENAWQFSKVYQEHSFMGSPSPSYYRWAINGWSNPQAQRYPMGKGAKPLYSWWDGKKLSYIEARKQIYIPLYSQAVRNTEAYETLVNIYRHSEKVYLLDFDGYNQRSLGMSLEDVVDFSGRKMGHAFVLAMMLEELI